LFKERILTAYYNSNESVTVEAYRFQVSRDTVAVRFTVKGQQTIFKNDYPLLNLN
jgi:archaellum component FlaF (FlaF/FlaG flagellin family)